VRTRSCRPATRWPGAAGRRWAAQRLTRAASASTTRVTLSPRCRQRAPRGGAQQCQLHLTACGPRNATRRPGAAGRCWAVVLGHHVWRRPSVKDARELHRLRMRQELRRHPRHSGTSLLGPTSDRRDAPPSMEHVCHRNGAAASPKAARTARRAPEAGAPRRERALLVSFAGGKHRVLRQYCATRQTTPRWCPPDHGQSPRTVRPRRPRPACTSRASSCLGGWVVSKAGARPSVRGVQGCRDRLHESGVARGGLLGSVGGG